jgi:sugar O-acyltransferase (sialic acid O-acetyltransferase NeuD family)
LSIISPSSKRMIILGAGGHGRVVGDIAELQGFNPVAFIDKRFPSLTHNLHWPIIGDRIDDVEGSFVGFVAIGANQLRLSQLDRLLSSGINCPALIHPTASVSRYATLEAGTVVMAHVVINAGAKLGRGVIANSGCTIDHDCMIGNGVHISPGANIAGGVSIADESWVGISACVKENIMIGRNVLVAAGSVVISSIADNQRVFGVPARLKSGL